MSDAGKKILVAEDDELLRKIIVDQLNKTYTTIPAKDGAEALGQIQIHRPDVIILDLLMPKMDGFQMLKELRALPDAALAKTPVIVVSNLSDQESMKKAESFSVEAYFTKNDVDFGILLKRIQRLFAQGPSVKV